MRALLSIRLSVMTDETTSPGRQRDAGREAAAAVGAAVIGEALDLDVSASKTSPFERPQLGEWLKSPDSFDVICWWRQDRAVRNMEHMHQLSAWAREHRKILVFNEGPGGQRFVLDFRNPMDPVTQLLITLFAFAAQIEAQAIQERVTGAQAAMRAMPLRWRGSRPPYGYLPVELPGGGWTLRQDPYAVEVIRRMVAELKGGKSAAEVARRLTADGIATPRDHWRAYKDREPEGAHWTSMSVGQQVLATPALMGHKVHGGSVVRSADGEPVPSTSDPIMTRQEWEEVQALLSSRTRDNGPRRDTDALLLGVLFCDSCGGRMYLSKLGQRPATYKCGHRSRGETCSAPAAVKMEWADEYTETEFLRRVGGVRVHEVRTVPGSDPRPEIAEVAAELERHYEKQGAQRSAAARAAWEKHAEALDARLASLEAQPVVEARTERVPGSTAYSVAWEAADKAARRQLLLEAGTHVTVRRGTPGGWRTLDTSRMTFRLTDEFYAAAAEEALAVEHAERHYA